MSQNLNKTYDKLIREAKDPNVKQRLIDSRETNQNQLIAMQAAQAKRREFQRRRENERGL